MINRGNIVEAFVGQEFLAYADPHFKADLYYWHKEERTSQAEVDYVTVINQKIIPVEVKSGASGRLKSIQTFLETHKDSPYGLRFYANSETSHATLHSFPLYAIAKTLGSE